jgi:hypothetical protein
VTNAILKMLKHILQKIYRSIPAIHELGQIRDGLAALNQKLAELESLRLFDVDLPSNPRYADSMRLLRHGFQVCSQNQEDGMIQEVFRRIGTTDQVFVEIGVGDGVENNTAFLLSQGWKGCWIDGNPAMSKTVAARPDIRGDCLRTLVSFVTRENIRESFQQLGVPKEFDLLSLDIDQNTYYVWEGLEQFRPRVVIVEYNGAIPPYVDWKVHYDPKRTFDGTLNSGASLKAFELLGRNLGYCLVGCDYLGVNAFFVRADLVNDKFCQPFTAENHFEPFRYALTHRRGHANSIPDRGLSNPPPHPA